MKTHLKADEERERNMVPIEEALAVSDRKNLRMLMMNVIRGDLKRFFGVNHVGFYVMTSRAEGLPMVLLEAAGYKVPSISFDIQTGPAEIIEDGKTGFLIPPFDLEQMEEKIELLIQKDALRKKFAQQAEKSRQKFALDKIVAQWERLLEEII